MRKMKEEIDWGEEVGNDEASVKIRTMRERERERRERELKQGIKYAGAQVKRCRRS